MKKLPIGASTLTSILNENGYYIDKTPFVKQLVAHGRYYFLSRPRRFGKSLFVDTLKQAFLAEKKYFKGLFLETHWDWDIQYPVIHISFGSGVIKTQANLESKIEELLITNAKSYEITYQFSSISGQFYELIQKLYQKYQQPVVILIDEYDKPILDNLTETETAIEIREGLKNLYSVIKDCDQWLKFVFFTGVSKFSKVSLFSGLNNLTDITLDKRYATICGYTHEELVQTFAERLENVDLELVKRWYNGYNFLGERVYNPYDVLLYLDKKEFRNYWFETATPSFLLTLIQKQSYYLPQIERLSVTEELLGSFDIEHIALETLLFQTGYLTIIDTDDLLGEMIFILGYPNLEVKRSLNHYLLNYFIHDPLPKVKNQQALLKALTNHEIDSLKEVFEAFFASIPYHWYINNPMNQYEGYYASIFYSYLVALGLEVIGEDTSNKGRIDLTVKLESQIYIIEFKVIDKQSPDENHQNTALAQIKTKRYFEKYQAEPALIYLIGIEFNPTERNIVDFAWEKL